MDAVGRLDVDVEAIRAAGGYALVTDDAFFVAAESPAVTGDSAWDGWTEVGFTTD